MKLLRDFLPLIVFFIAFKVYDVYVATAALIALTAVQISYMWLRYRKVEKMYLVAFAFLLVFGGMTLWLHDIRFLKWKISIVNWLFAVVFIGSEFIGKQNIIERVMGKSVVLPRHVWKKLNMSWATFFLLVGCFNLYVAFTFSTEVWVQFKVFGLLGITVVFSIGQAIYIAHYVKKHEHANNAGE
ncbi:MAG: septation protein A [Thiotrichales bacterium]|nr:MAG: septation protein A [Thiotrichales bacterium]